MKKHKSLFYIIFAIILGIIFGIFSKYIDKSFNISFSPIFDIFGSLFLNSLLLIVLPLIISSIITGINNFGKEQNFKKVGKRTIFLFIATNISGIVLGLLIINILKPQLIDAASHLSTKSSDISNIQIAAESVGNVKDIIMNVIPKNIFDALASMQILGIIFFSIFFGYALTKVHGRPHDILTNFFKAIFETMINFTHIIMKVLPLGVFFLVARDFSKTGLNSLISYGFYLSIILIGFFLHIIITIPLFLKLVANINPIKHLKNMSEALVTAFSTCSSSATLPVTMDNLQENAKVSPKIVGLVAPLGTTINLSASALFVTISSAFISSVYGIELTFPMQVVIFILSFLTTFGVAAIPSGCLITTMLVLKAIGIPAEGIGKVLAVDRIIDMFRTMANVYSVSATTAIVDKLSKKDLK